MDVFSVSQGVEQTDAEELCRSVQYDPRYEEKAHDPEVFARSLDDFQCTLDATCREVFVMGRVHGLI